MYACIAMEDSHTAKMKLDETKADLEADAFFAVFDGHGGTSQFAFILNMKTRL